MESAQSLYKGRVIRRRAPDQASPSSAAVQAVPPAVEIAHKQAAAIVAAARAEAEGLLASARDAAEIELAGRLAALDRDYRRDLVDLQPRLAELVRRAVEEILDEMPPAALATKLVKRALRDLPHRDVVLRCAPGDVDRAEIAVNAIRAEGARLVPAVTADPLIEAEAWRLEAGGVAIEIGAGAQVEMLSGVLSAALQDDIRLGPA
ncbi:hypothetical protein GCM10007036_43690 [Alsobacter metallidurans]|uniref:Uncharacterized protein n=1 Tax=Alsobacter metallidurans TaxID=340221 RepID=A0A917MKD5_9HYPH|nr:hypothetical protein GCM10007036_43690 [Alsobacter metallidurans]